MRILKLKPSWGSNSLWTKNRWVVFSSAKATANLLEFPNLDDVLDKIINVVHSKHHSNLWVLIFDANSIANLKRLKLKDCIKARLKFMKIKEKDFLHSLKKMCESDSAVLRINWQKVNIWLLRLWITTRAAKRELPKMAWIYAYK